MRDLTKGRVYRTSHFRRYASNPARLVAKLVAQGHLERLQHGLYHAPKTGTFGKVPPSEDALLKARFGRSPYLRTGPEVWNGLGLGSTAVEAVPLVYNRSFTGTVDFGGRRFEFRRVRFPRAPTPEYFVVDLLENTGRAGVDSNEILDLLTVAVADGRFHPERLRDRTLTARPCRIGSGPRFQILSSRVGSQDFSVRSAKEVADEETKSWKHPRELPG